MEIEVIENLLVNYDGSALCVAEEGSQQILFFNKLCETMCPDIKKGMLVDEMYDILSESFDITNKNGMTFLVADKNALFSDRYFVSENKVTLNSGNQICLYVFHQINFMQFYDDFVNFVNSRLFLSDCDMSVIVNLSSGDYYITYEKGNSKKIVNVADVVERDWDSRVENYLKNEICEDSYDKYRNNMLLESLRGDFENEIETKEIKYNYYLDGDVFTRKAVFNFIEYNGIPVACIKYYEQN